MGWTENIRRQYRREGLRYASDPTDDEWALISPFVPSHAKLSRPRKTDPPRNYESDSKTAARG